MCNYYRQNIFYNSNQIRDNKRHFLFSELNRLIISDANREDSGRYRCEAANEFSSDSNSVDIRVAGEWLCVFFNTNNLTHTFNVIDFFQVSLFIPIARITRSLPIASLSCRPSIARTSTTQSFAADHAPRLVSCRREDPISTTREEERDRFCECSYKIRNRFFGISDTRDSTYRFWIVAGGIRSRKKNERKYE